MLSFIKIHPADNVAVALTDLKAQTPIALDGEEFLLPADIARGHKFALRPLASGESVIKYGYPIGRTTAAIKTGEWIHTHNLKTGLGEVLTYTYQPNYLPLARDEDHFFSGYRQPDGRAGVRNEIWIIPTVGCLNSVVSAIERQAQSLRRGSIDSIAAFPHPYGCSQMGDDQENTKTILADLINHPNAGGVLVLGLGCENSSIAELKKLIGPYDERRVKFLIAQDSADEIADGLALVEELIDYTADRHREPISCRELIIGLKCGGSDGLSGITANPTVGAFSDRLIAAGGTTILTEVPEMFGAETILMNRCASRELFEKTVALINDFKNYFIAHNQTIYENPSPGNKKGGISTLEDKSLGCTQKSGSAPVEGVLAYGEPVRHKGLHLLSAPGNDLVASTALAASGAHIILFTTGRGTPFACPVPTVKISSNSALYDSKRKWIDFNCGQLISGQETLDSLGQKLFDYVLAVASGEKVKSELSGFHDMAIFKQGVTL